MSFVSRDYQPNYVMTGSWDPSGPDYPGTMKDANWGSSPHNPENWENGQNPYTDPNRFLLQYAKAVKDALRPGSGEIAAQIKGIPAADGRIGPKVQMDVPGYSDDQTIGTVGIFDPEPNNPKAAEYGFDPYIRQTTPMRRYGSYSHPAVPGGIPAHPDFNEEATRNSKIYGRYMEGVKPGNMPGYVFLE